VLSELISRFLNLWAFARMGNNNKDIRIFSFMFIGFEEQNKNK
jgi:hypothetical protein